MEKKLSKSTLLEIEAGKAALARKQVKPPEESKKKRTRRTKEQIEADQKALEERMQASEQQEPELPDVDADVDIDAILDD